MYTLYMALYFQAAINYNLKVNILYFKADCLLYLTNNYFFYKLKNVNKNNKNFIIVLLLKTLKLIEIFKRIVQI
jgi:hypothetical protein